MAELMTMLQERLEGKKKFEPLQLNHLTYILLILLPPPPSIPMSSIAQSNSYFKKPGP